MRRETARPRVSSPGILQSADDARAFLAVDHAIARRRRDHRAQDQHGACRCPASTSPVSPNGLPAGGASISPWAAGLALRLVVLERLEGKSADQGEPAERRRRCRAIRARPSCRAAARRARPAPRSSQAVLSGKRLRLLEEVAGRLAGGASDRAVGPAPMPVCFSIAAAPPFRPETVSNRLPNSPPTADRLCACAGRPAPSIWLSSLLASNMGRPPSCEERHLGFAPRGDRPRCGNLSLENSRSSILPARAIGCFAATAIASSCFRIREYQADNDFPGLGERPVRHQELALRTRTVLRLLRPQPVAGPFACAPPPPARPRIARASGFSSARIGCDCIMTQALFRCRHRRTIAPADPTNVHETRPSYGDEAKSRRSAREPNFARHPYPLVNCISASLA